MVVGEETVGRLGPGGDALSRPVKARERLGSAQLDRCPTPCVRFCLEQPIVGVEGGLEVTSGQAQVGLDA